MKHTIPPPHQNRYLEAVEQLDHLKQVAADLATERENLKKEATEDQAGRELKLRFKEWQSKADDMARRTEKRLEELRRATKELQESSDGQKRRLENLGKELEELEGDLDGAMD